MVGEQLLEPERYGEQFHRLYVNTHEKKHATSNRAKHRKKKPAEKRKHPCKLHGLISNNTQNATSPTTIEPIELEPNASKFAIFSAVRATVLECDAKLAQLLGGTTDPANRKTSPLCCGICASSCKAAAKLGTTVDCRCHSSATHSSVKRVKSVNEAHNESDNESVSDDTAVLEREKAAVVPVQVPQMVGAGLRSLFELIAEARTQNPAMCTKALRALFNVIQGQIPESFRSEPNDLIQPLYDLLLDLATSTDPNRGSPDSWSAMGCSALLGLCVARGDTGKTLKAVAALLMSPNASALQSIQLPQVLASLQRTIFAVALGHPTPPDFLRRGIPKRSFIGQFYVDAELVGGGGASDPMSQPSIAATGKHVFLLVGQTLLKLGSGYGGTLLGHVYAKNENMDKERGGWIGFSGGTLYYKKLCKRSTDSLLIVDQQSLAVVGSAAVRAPPPPNTSGRSTPGQGLREHQTGLLFTDGESVFAICSSSKEDMLVVKMIHSSRQAINSVPDMMLKLSRRNFRTLGYAAFEEELLSAALHQTIQTSFNPFEPKLPRHLDVLSIGCGKDFSLVRTTNGKVFFYGKAASLDLKSSGRTPSMRPAEMIVSKTAASVQVAVGHDGIHALIVCDDGSAHFVGTARRGEDGDSSKNRRPPRACKPKRLAKLEDHHVVQAACNNGTSAFVTKTGKLIMYGKDTAHCDPNGFVTDLDEQHMTRVALGKAHCAAVNAVGQLFTFGINNKGQCGRSAAPPGFGQISTGGSPGHASHSATSVVVANHVTRTTANEAKEASNSKEYNMCDIEEHQVEQGQCRVCAFCRECTGYNISCVVTQMIAMDQRIPGADCSCGRGEAGCVKCGACVTCISMQENGTKDTSPFNFLLRQRSKSITMRSHAAKRDELHYSDGIVVANGLDSAIERDAPRVAPLSPQQVHLPTTSPVVQISCGLHHTVVLTLSGECFTFGSNQYGQLGTGTLQAQMEPFAVRVVGAISKIAAGSNHTVLLTTKGIVYTFGNHTKGQLGRVADVPAIENTAPTGGGGGSPIVLESWNAAVNRQQFLWNCSPGPVDGIGPNFGKKAIWIGASGDQTFMKIDESLVTGSSLGGFNVVADKNTIVLIPESPMSFSCLSICRRDGSCMAHSTDQADFISSFAAIDKADNRHAALAQLASADKCNQNVDHQNPQEKLVQPVPPPRPPVYDRMSQSVHEARNQIFEEADRYRSSSRKQREYAPKGKPLRLAFEIDHFYQVLWSYDSSTRVLSKYNVVASELPQESEHSNTQAILSPELSVPLSAPVEVTRSQVSLNILASLDVLTYGQDSIPGCFESERPELAENMDKDLMGEYQLVSRFETMGGGWGYSGHSVEAIRFMADTDIILYGFAMFGGRGEYTCKLKLYHLGKNGSREEDDGVLVAETEEIPYECPAKSKYNIMLPRPLTAPAGHWYLVWARVAGPSSDCGSTGQSVVSTEDQIVFTFLSSKKANNGTDVNSGQIPSILYRVVNHDLKPQPLLDAEPVIAISRLFASTVTRECFDSLVNLLNWSWSNFKITLTELKDKKTLPKTNASLNRYFYINKSCLRLLRKYTNEIYPNDLRTRSAQLTKKTSAPETPATQIYVLNQGPSVPKGVSPSLKSWMGSSMDASTPTSCNAPRKINTENLQLAESIGDVRALLTHILCDELPADLEPEAAHASQKILDECHRTFLACFNAFYPTATLKWNCLCDMLGQEEKMLMDGRLQTRLLSAIVGGLCSPTVRLRQTFSLVAGNWQDSKSIVSPSDNSGLPMLTSMDLHQYPVLVEQMIYRSQQEKCFRNNGWTFKDVLFRLLDIISQPIRTRIENIYNHGSIYSAAAIERDHHQKLVDNCCHLLARLLAEIVYQSCCVDPEQPIPARMLHTTCSRFGRTDAGRTWNTGNFGPDAILFSVNRPGIAIAGAMVFSGSGSYEFQLELMFDTIEVPCQHKWETLETVTGSFEHETAQNDMIEIKFDRPVHIKENTRYAIRFCAQGARTCSGDAGLSSIRGPCGAMFSFYPCDLSFNGTSTSRGQIPCLLYYSSPLRNDVAYSNKILREIHARDTALQIATDITKRCSELLVLTRNTLATSVSPSEKSIISSNNTQTIDSEQNITPIEEHLDIAFSGGQNSIDTNIGIASARDHLSKRIESFSKGIMETLKFAEKRSNNPFEYEIEIGATEIQEIHHQNEERPAANLFNVLKQRVGSVSNGNAGDLDGADGEPLKMPRRKSSSFSDDEETDREQTCFETLRLFETRSASIFNTLLPLVLAHIGTLASHDPKSSVQILSLVRDILPHVSALNQLAVGKDKSAETIDAVPAMDNSKENIFSKDIDEARQHLHDLASTSNHYCIVESEHPYKSATISSFRVEFPRSVQWFTIEFDPQCGTAQLEDNLLVSIPSRPVSFSAQKSSDVEHPLTNPFITVNHPKFSVVRNATISTSNQPADQPTNFNNSEDRVVVRSFNMAANWAPTALILPGNRVDFTLETASHYSQDKYVNKYGFRCLVVGYENPSAAQFPNACLSRLESELAYLGGMCSASLMKKDLHLPDDDATVVVSGIDEVLQTHASLLSKGLALTDSVLTVNQALDQYLPIGGQSNERQFLKDFVSAAPGSSGARLAAWLQPEPRLDPNRCEIKFPADPVRFGWPNQLQIILRDQYGEAVYIPNVKIEIKATPCTALSHFGVRQSKTFSEPPTLPKPPPKVEYEPTIIDTMCLKAITSMAAYEDYSFEELRFSHPSQHRNTETMIAEDMDNLTFAAVWTPSSIGTFSLACTIDGVTVEEVYRVEVKDAGNPPPPQLEAIKKNQPPNKLRRFMAKNSAGLRIRSHPTLQSEQVGIVKMDGIIALVDEQENDDGIWVRLSTESIRQHCTSDWFPSEAWCLQYNQHLGRTLLHPVVEPTETRSATIVSPEGPPTPTPTIHRLTASNEHTGPSSSKKPSAASNSSSESPSKKPAYDFSVNKVPVSINPFVFSQSPVVSTSIPGDEELLNSANNPVDDDPYGKFFEEEMIDVDLDGAEFEVGPPLDFSGAGFPHIDEHEDLGEGGSGQSSQIGNALAGVVGGGASKLQALHKWFTGDSLDGRDFSKKKSELSELASVSVRDLVKAIGGHEGRSNGNDNAASISSSPVRAPGKGASDGSASASGSRSIDVSDRLFMMGSSLVKDTTPTSSPGNSPYPGCSQSNIVRNSQNDSTTTVRRRSPQSSPRKSRNKRRAPISTPLTFYDDDHSRRTDIFETDVDVTAKSTAAPISKRALPSSLAESLRAVFAAFLWHEGVVHDAMACSSFLKFHPTLPKDVALMDATPIDRTVETEFLSREQRAQQRYSVEVANAGNYLNIRPSTLETLTKSGNLSVLNRRSRKTEDQPKLQSLPEMVTVCPPALRCLVYLWDQLSGNCVQMIQSIASTQPTKNSPAKFKVQKHQGNQTPAESSNETDAKKNSKKDEGTWCELCEIFLPIPVTYHMRIVHPGCEKPSRGKGYNSSGTFCEGWAGNCGEGGKGASSWYIMCETCRNKFMFRNMNVNNVNASATNSNSGTPKASASNQPKYDSLFGIKSDLIINSDAYRMMKDNAMFLLELAASSPGHTSLTTTTGQKRSSPSMPIVTESQLNQITSDLQKPCSSRTVIDVGFSLNKSRNSLAFQSRGPSFSASTPYHIGRRSDVPANVVSPELLWQAPESFACIEVLGASSISHQGPSTIFDINSGMDFDRPMSELSIDSIDRSFGAGGSLMTNSTASTTNQVSSLTRFHRSMSMGQGWPSQQFPTKYLPAPLDGGQSSGTHTKVVMRRRNNTSCDDGGSFLLCNPSENLRKLVPESICNATLIKPVEPTSGSPTSRVSDLHSELPFSRQDPSQQRSKPIEIPLKLSPENSICLLSRSTMVFILEPHNLEQLRYTLKRNLRISTCRIYSLQALNWLMRTVTQTACIHDLMWWFVSSLKPPVLVSPAQEATVDQIENEPNRIDENTQEVALEHPVSSNLFCGRITLLLTQSFHTYLQTVADLTLLLPPGSALQQIAIQCFGIKFRQADHQFLHRSHVFGNISKILSRSDEQNENQLQLSQAGMLESVAPSIWPGGSNGGSETRIMSLVDMAGMFELVVSSHQATAQNLTDASTETFWESDDEERNKSKSIEVSINKPGYMCMVVCVHIDNSRDLQNKVSHLLMYSGPSLGDSVLIRCAELEATASGTWIYGTVKDPTHIHFRLELRGPENTLRVRQVKLLGVPVGPDGDVVFRNHSKLTNTSQIQQRSCESETLRVFRLISAQVFGKLILGANKESSMSSSRSAAACLESSSTSLADSLDLREHMVGILFSRSKLSHLQKQVIVHIVHAIRKETQRAKDEWEQANAALPSEGTDERSESSSENSRAADTYCFEMLSMVLALSGSTVGRAYLSQQQGLLKDLLILLHTGSDRVQRQVTSLLRRILPEIAPETFATLLGVRTMPPVDYGIAHQDQTTFDMNRMGILDIFLTVIAKSLQLQTKTKVGASSFGQNKTPPSSMKLAQCIDLSVNTRTDSSPKPDEIIAIPKSASDLAEELLYDFGTTSKKYVNEYETIRRRTSENQRNLNQRWFFRGAISAKQSENIIGLIRDMAGGKFSEQWSRVTKSAIAESIMNLTRLDDKFREYEHCLKTGTLWLALASLCVLDKDHVDRLSSGRWSNASETRPLCANHDDGTSPAVIQCEVCGSLCADCDRFLHLSRKTRSHIRTVCKEEEEAIRVELHESCGRTKLFWLLALADSKTLKAMVEFRDISHSRLGSGPLGAAVGRCRFCGVTGNSGLLAVGNVCADAQCQEHAGDACSKSKGCGHPCGGVTGELKCLPCLQVGCHSAAVAVGDGAKVGPKLTQDADDMCMICFVEALSCAPAIQLDCGHVFHFQCCRTVIKRRWNGPRITFGFSQCPICKIDINHPLLLDILTPIMELKNDVQRKAVMRLEYEGQLKTTDKRDLATHAMDRYAYYVCFKCNKAYYGGEARCDAEIGDKYDPQELVCGACSDVARAQMCPKHGTDFLEYKCRYCCAVAVFFCFGTTHFCDTCHDDFQRLTTIPKAELPRCPAGPKAQQMMGDDCPLHIVHPATGEEFALGCGVCRNAQTF